MKANPTIELLHEELSQMGRLYHEAQHTIAVQRETIARLENELNASRARYDDLYMGLVDCFRTSHLAFGPA